MIAKSRHHAKLEARLGHTFADPALLERALTHSSAISPAKRVEQTYQRLEFLGDRVLGLVVADLLWRKYPASSEGELHRTLANLVRAESCARIARAIEVGPELRLGDSERKTGGRENDAILADVCEAIIGAVYVDAGFERAYEIVQGMLGDAVDIAEKAGPSAKTVLQEWSDARGLGLPVYKELGRRGPDHAPEFTISVAVTGLDEVVATGPTKRIAEHKAAQTFLVREGIGEAHE
ncbi:MAG: ribonuclease III [Devosia sp.]